MKTWKNAEIVAISIEETAGGQIDSRIEATVVSVSLFSGIKVKTYNDNLTNTDVPSEQPGEIPSTPSTGTNSLS